MKYKLIISILCGIFLFSCDSGKIKINIDWVDLYGIETVDFNERPVNLRYLSHGDVYEGEDSIKLSDGTYQYIRYKKLNPNTDKQVVFTENKVRYLGVSCNRIDIGCDLYSSFKEPENNQKIEIYLFKNLLPDDDNKLIFPKNKQVLGYSYDFVQDNYIYTVISKNNVIDLDMKNMRKRSVISPYLDQPKVLLYTLSDDEVVYLCKDKNPYFIADPEQYVTYFVISNLDNKILELNRVYIIDTAFKYKAQSLDQLDF